MRRQLPGIVRWLISRFATGPDKEIIEGDFDEALREAKPYSFHYYTLIIKELLGIMRVSHLKRRRSKQPSGLNANLLKVITRNLKRKWSYTLINVVGLSISLTVFALILAYVSHELSYDRYHAAHDRIFRITYQENATELTNGHWARVPLDFVNKLPDYFPQIEQLIRFQSFRYRDVQVEDQAFREHYAFSVDPEVFDVLDMDFIQGNPNEALQQPNSVVLTESIALKYFGTADVFGRTIKTTDNNRQLQTYQVTGVIKDVPGNTHLPIHLLTSINSSEARRGWAYIYVKLKEKQDAQVISTKMPEFIATHAPDPETSAMFKLQPIQDIHLRSHLSREISINNQVSYILIFLGASLFLLIVAVINFANLNTVQSFSRIRELGVRKVLGGSRAHLKKYFYLESFFLFAISLLISTFGYLTFLGPLEQYMGLAIQPDHFTLTLIALILMVLVPWISSLYPAQGLVKLSVIHSLKSQLPSSNKLQGRKALIGLQFGLAMALISSMHITQTQFQYIQNKNLGYQEDQILAIRHMPDEAKNNLDLIREEFSSLPSVNAVSAVMELQGSAVRDGIILLKPGQEQEDGVPVDIQIVAPNFPELMAMEFVAGTTFRKESYPTIPEGTSITDIFATISQRKRTYVLNETAARMLGWNDPTQAVGESIRGNNLFYQLAEGPIVGVVRDYHQESLHATIDPVIMVYEPIWLNHLLLKIEGKELFRTVDQLQTKWQARFAGSPMDMVFLDQELDRLYEGERKQKDLLQVFTAITLMVATLGLLGLMGYSLRIRQKELAVRKVLGADLMALVRLLAKEYLLSLLIGIGLAIPLVWFTMNQWLQNYAYHADIQITSFALSAILLSVLVLVPLITQIFRNDRNPSDVLKSE